MEENKMLEINTIHLGDSYKLIKDIPDKSVDLVIIDPPYEIVGGGCMTGIFKDRGTRHFNAIEDKNLTTGFDDSILIELERVMKRTNIYIWCNKNQIHQLLNFFDNGNRLFEFTLWNKTNPIPFLNNNWLNDKEYCLHFRDKGVPLYGDYSTKQTVFTQSANTDDKLHFDHPTIKPIERIKHFIINSSQPNDLILDCFSGSGTTCVAAKELNRRFIGIEIDANYHRISVERLNGITTSGQTSIFTDFEQQDIFDFIGDEHGTSDNKGLI